jgi:hypothetical protein
MNEKDIKLMLYLDFQS